MNIAMPTCSGTSQRSCMYHAKMPTRSASTLMMLIISPLVRLRLDWLESARLFWYTTATSADRARIPACCMRKFHCPCDRHSSTLAAMKARTRRCPWLAYLSSPLRYCTRESMRYGPT